MRIVLFLTIMSLVLSSCVSSRDYESPKHVIVAENILSKSGSKLSQKHQMYYVGSRGRMMTCVKSIGLIFEIFRPLTQDELRELIVKCVLEFLEDINSNRDILPYLVVSPFSPINIEIDIYIYNRGGSNVYNPLIEVVYVSAGKITYCTRSSTKQFGYENVYKETFEEALEKLNRSYMPYND